MEKFIPLLLLILIFTFLFFFLIFSDNHPHPSKENLVCTDLQGFYDTGKETKYLSFEFTSSYLKKKYRKVESNIYARKMFQFIERCPNLLELSIENCPFLTDKNFKLTKKCLKIFENLEHLSIINCPNLFDESLNEVFENCVNIESLCLSNYKNFSGKALQEMCFPDLKELELTGCENLTDDSLLTILAFHPNLTGLYIGSIPNLISLRKILERCPKLRNLDISNSNFTNFEDIPILNLEYLDASNSRIDNQSLFKMTSKHLEYLDISSCPLLTKPPLHFSGLKELKIGGCNNFSEDLILEILKNIPALNSLSVSNSPNLSENFFKEIPVKCPHLINLDCSLCLSLNTDLFLEIRKNLKHFKVDGCSNINPFVLLRSVSLRS